MLDGLRNWRARCLGRKTVRRLYPVLIRRYGRGELYTPGQIERALKITGLGGRYRPYAYAVFTRPAEIAKLAPLLQAKVLPLTRRDGIARALQFYALAHLQTILHTAGSDGDAGDVGSLGDGGSGGSGGDGGGDG